MAETSGFFQSMIDEDTGGYDREYVAKQFADYFALFIKNGVFGSPTNQLLVEPGQSGLSVVVKAGNAFIDGMWYNNSTDKQIFLVPNYESQTRVDTIRVRMSQVTRMITAEVFTGDSELERGEDIYDLQLATVNVQPFAERISAANIRDTRPDESVCGFVTQLLNVQTTEDLFAQYQAIFNEWFAGVKGTLGEDAAGNLLVKIEEVSTSVVDLKTFLKKNDRRLVDLTLGFVVWSFGDHLRDSIAYPPSYRMDGYHKDLFCFSSNVALADLWDRGGGFEVIYYNFTKQSPKESGDIIETLPSNSLQYPWPELKTTGIIRLFGAPNSNDRFTITADLHPENDSKYTGVWSRQLVWETYGTSESWGSQFMLGLRMDFYAKKLADLSSVTEKLTQSVRVCIPMAVIFYGLEREPRTRTFWEKGLVVSKDYLGFGFDNQYYPEGMEEE